jgi:hypothetical protein
MDMSVHDGDHLLLLCLEIAFEVHDPLLYLVLARPVLVRALLLQDYVSYSCTQLRLEVLHLVVQDLHTVRVLVRSLTCLHSSLPFLLFFGPITR